MKENLPVALVVDDDEMFLRLLAAAAGRAGFAVETAATAAAARTAFTNLGDRVALLLFDQVLPDGRGAELAAELGETRKIPTLVVSGDPAAAGEVSRVSPRFAFLRKPFRAEEVTRFAAKALAGKGAP